MISNHYISTKELARLTNTSATTWAKRRIKGEPYTPPFYKIGRDVRYKLTEVHAWIDEQAHHSTSEYT